MSSAIPHALVFLPELVILLMAGVVLGVTVTGSEPVIQYQRAQRLALWTTLLVLGALVLTQLDPAAGWEATGGFILDPLAVLFKGSIVSGTLMTIVYGGRYWHSERPMMPEYHLLILFALLGMMVMASASNTLMFYLGLELMSLSLYALVALDRSNPEATEAAMKYFVLGAVASGMLLYGFSLLYGLTGSLELDALGVAMSQGLNHDPAMILAFLLVISGLMFKLGAAPFHMWLPDVYHGSPLPSMLVIGVAPKLAAMVFILRLMMESGDGLNGLFADVAVICALLSIIIGNLAALMQTNLKRLLAYSTISHMGFIFLGFSAADTSGYAGATFYMFIYLLGFMAFAGSLVYLSQSCDAETQSDDIGALSGLYKRNPLIAAVMAVSLFSMAGVPPTAGFFAKLAVLMSAAQAGFLWLVVVALIFSVVGAYYYLRIIRYIYFETGEEKTALMESSGNRVFLGLNGLLILVLGCMPGLLWQFCYTMLANNSYL